MFPVMLFLLPRGVMSPQDSWLVSCARACCSLLGWITFFASSCLSFELGRAVMVLEPVVEEVSNIGCGVAISIHESFVHCLLGLAIVVVVVVITSPPQLELLESPAQLLLHLGCAIADEDV